jgi:hypothetical protein
MSNAQKRARRVMAEGEAKRRTWNPDPNSAHARVYRWWQNKTRQYVSQENFCHYWRVVLIWALLHWLAKPFLYLLGTAVIGGVVWLTALYADTALAVASVVGLFIYVVYGAVVSLQLAYELNLEKEGVPWLGARPRVVRVLAYVLALPVILFCAIIVSIVMALKWLHDKYDLYAKVGRWLINARPGKSKFVSWLRPWVIMLTLAVAALGVFEYTWLLVTLVAVAIPTVLLLAIVGVAYVSSKVEDWSAKRQRRIREEARQWQVDAALRVIFEVLHPKWANDEDKYVAWRVRYEAYWWGEVYDMSVTRHIDNLRNRRLQTEVCRRLGLLNKRIELGYYEFAMRSPRQPSRLQRGLVAVGDYLQLIWSVVLTKKWGICPFVEILPEPAEKPNEA